MIIVTKNFFDIQERENFKVGDEFKRSDEREGEIVAAKKGAKADSAEGKKAKAFKKLRLEQEEVAKKKAGAARKNRNTMHNR